MSQVKTIIGIAGASGAGKSRLAIELLRRLRESRTASEVAILHEDSYYRRRDELTLPQRSAINYDHPDAIEHELLESHLTQLRAGHAVDIPVYDYAVHNRVDQYQRLEPATVLILEGILILHRPALRELLDLRVFVDVPLDICLSRRLKRDLHERGRQLDAVLAQYHQTVRPMYFRFVEPSRDQADLIIPRGGKNANAIQVLQDHLDRILDPRELGSS